MFLLKIKKIFLLLIISTINIINAQDSNSIITINSNPIDSNYWWLSKNNFGKYLIKNEVEYQWELNTSKTNYKISLSNAYSKNDKIKFGESFIKHNFSKNSFVRMGKYYRDFSQYLNDDISMGSMLVSKNAQPMPKIGIFTSKNIKRNKEISFDFGLAHGRFKKNYHYNQAPFLHEKFIYMNINNENYKIAVGLVHEAIWGGSSFKLGKFPSKFADFAKIVISDDGYDIGTHQNALGNHLGIWDFHFEKTNNDKTLQLYYQHFFEDTSSLRFANKIDGLWGIELKNYISDTNILFEYLDTSNCCTDPPYQDDKYYWNYQYRDGWRYQDKIIGNPFVNNLQLEDTRELVDNYLTPESVKVFHVGISGKIFSNYKYKVKTSKEIGSKENIKYKIDLSKTIKNTYDINIFMVNSNKNNGLGLSFSIVF